MEDATECMYATEALTAARDYLKATEPKHPAVVALENWWMKPPSREFPPSPRESFLAGYKAGIQRALSHPRRIAEELNTIPES